MGWNSLYHRDLSGPERRTRASKKILWDHDWALWGRVGRGGVGRGEGELRGRGGGRRAVEGELCRVGGNCSASSSGPVINIRDLTLKIHRNNATEKLAQSLTLTWYKNNWRCDYKCCSTWQILRISMILHIYDRPMPIVCDSYLWVFVSYGIINENVNSSN